MLANLSSQRTVSPVRTKEISGPEPGAPSGWCGGRVGRAITPGVIGLLRAEDLGADAPDRNPERNETVS